MPNLKDNQFLKDETLTFRLPLKLKRAIKRCAKENNQSMAEWIEMILRAEISTNWKTPAEIKKEKELWAKYL